ncbi:eukaryotic translation initiation factor 4 gamma 3-like isoform X2 [Ctenocephalides felis]|uniref:eukaryotic translation initiation factor 4 gamma 3-like isoform X2 n=1 Tax=Ctenocephalides felis TaxID=7515 RepID=UPI000E6E40BD|nr:eukaryotic translation initiation factor 4 gamma 3-like isoform X2 [Ctenocephalides felis]
MNDTDGWTVVMNGHGAKSSRKENQPGKQQATSAINQQQNSNKDVPQAPRPLYQQKQQQSNAGAVLNANISVPMPQPPKPNNKTQRNKEINRKGAEKQANASDMDAFNSPATPPAVPATAPPSSMPPPQPQMQPTTNPAANIVPVSNNIESSEIPAKEDATLNCNTPPASEANKLVPDNKDNSFASMISNNMNKPAPLASKNVLPKTLEGTKKVDVTSIVKGSDVMPKFTKKESPKESLDLLNLTEEEKLVRAKNEENKAKMEESQSETIGDGKVTLKYIYQEDQWSPTNQTGKKVYGRDFLVALQSDPKSKVKPNLPDMDVVLKEGANRQLSRDPPRNFPSLNRQHDALFPGFAKSQSQRGKSGGSKGGSVSSKPGIIHVSLSLRDEVKLHETENAWKPSHMKNVNVNDDSRQTEELYKKVRGVLNKLTPQKFETLVRQVRDLDINTTERLKGVMDLVFEKAVDEPSFSVAYAYMCKELALIQVPADQQNGQSSTVEYVNFRKLLLSRCQNEFEKNTVDETAREVKLKEIEACTDPEKKKELQFNLEEEERKIRVKSVGNVRFIGELFKQGMLTTKIMMQCLRMLLQSIEEESLECLCKLLTTIGRDLEINKNQDLKPTFLKMQEIVDRKHGKISSRVRFMLQDVIELRLNKWKPRHNDTNPKTMDQIQKEAENEQMQIQLMNSTPTPRKDNDRRGNMGSMGSNDGRKRSQMNEDGWSTAGGRGSRSGHSFPDMSKLRQSLMPAIHATEDISLGKPQYGNWGHGSNMKSTPSQINYYSALENVEDDRRGSRNKNDPGYHSKGPSMERYKKYDENRSSRSGSQHRSRDNSSSRSHAPLHTGSGRSQQLPGPMSNMPQMTRQGSMPPPVMTPAFNQPPPQSQTQPQVDSNIPKEDIPEKLLNKMKLRIVDIVEDYANSSFKIEAAGQEIQSLCTTNQLYGFLRELYMACLEKNQVLREKAAQIVVHMIKNKLLPIKSYLCGLEEVLEFADDLRVDIPKMWEYLADLIAPVLASECVNLKDIHKISHVLISQDLAGEFIAAIFKTISKEKGPGRVKDIWAKSGLSWKSFMDEKKVDDFVKSKELDYVTGGAIHAINSSSHLSMKQIQERILKFMTENDSDANIEQWITMNVGDMSNTPAFARTLMTAVCEHSVTKHSKAWVLLENVFKKHYDLLTTYISNKPDCELQALYAIQCYMHKLEYPQGVLVQLFNMLWDSGIITGDSFLQWKNSTDPAEIEGKGVAEKCLVSFFTVLQEQDDESSTEE